MAKDGAEAGAEAHEENEVEEEEEEERDEEEEEDEEEEAIRCPGPPESQQGLSGMEGVDAHMP